MKDVIFVSKFWKKDRKYIYKVEVQKLWRTTEFFLFWEEDWRNEEDSIKWKAQSIVDNMRIDNIEYANQVIDTMKFDLDVINMWDLSPKKWYVVYRNSIPLELNVHFETWNLYWKKIALKKWDLDTFLNLLK